MYVRGFRAHVGTRIGALVLGAVLLVAAGVFLTFGLLLIVGLTVVGLAVGIAAALYRRLTGAPPATAAHRQALRELDPAMEVLPPPPPIEERQPVDRSESEHNS